MPVGYKNLILIDNSRSVGDANFLLCKETAKYICGNLNSGDSCRIAVFGEGIDYLTEYTDDVSILNNTIEGLETADRDTYITDNLVDVLSEWKEQDVACRNIILFTDGKEKESVRHANEELYYMLSEAGYPIYVVQCVETRNEPVLKNLSAIATISKGKLILTEFEGSDAGSEITMGDIILSSIEETRQRTLSGESSEDTVNEGESETGKQPETTSTDELYIESDTKAPSGEVLLNTQINDDEEIPYNTDHVLTESYARDDNTPIIVSKKNDGNGNYFNVIFPVVGLLFAITFAVVIYLITHRNCRLKKRDKKALKNMGESFELESIIAENAEDYDCTTHRLFEDTNATRILDQCEGGYDIVLEDCTDPTRIFRASGNGSLVVGRSPGLCDIVIDRDDSISSRHCELSVVDGSWYVKDLHSSNGTRVNSNKVFQELLLKNGDILRLGQSALQVRI